MTESDDSQSETETTTAYENEAQGSSEENGSSGSSSDRSSGSSSDSAAAASDTESGQEEETQTEAVSKEPVAKATKSGNVMGKDFVGELSKKEIGSVTFLNTLEAMPDEAWDLSRVENTQNMFAGTIWEE